ncbi:MAG: outer membrane beta-barrel protein [Nitrospirota bacterium]
MQTSNSRQDNLLHRTGRWLAAGALTIWGLSGMPAQAETYIAGQAGYTMAQDTARGRINDPTYAGLLTGTSVSTVDLNNSLMYGMKIGRYFDAIPWLGIELEGFITTPHRPQQRLTLGLPGTGSILVDESGATNRIVVVSPNVVFRYQAGAFEPYIAAGPGIFFLHQRQLSTTPGGLTYSQSDTGFGLNTQVGLRYRLTEHVALFGEWKFNYARVDLSGQADAGHYGIDTLVTLHHFVFGVGYHF